MTSFVVLQHNDQPAAKRLEKTVFVRDAFSIVALAFPILWLFWHRLWIVGGCALVLYMIGSMIVGAHAEYFWMFMVFNAFLSLLVAIEGSALRMAALRLSGYTDLAIVEAENLEQAQLKWALGQKAADPAPEKKLKSMLQTKYDDDLIFSPSGHN